MKETTHKRTRKRTIEAFGKYFTEPSLRDAGKRHKVDAQILRDSFEIPADMQNVGQGKYYYVKTFGCQMNAHDTEVITGILNLLGYESTEDTEQADVILLNTCAVRENAENKVFGELGHLKHLKAQKPDLILGVCGCMPQEEAVVERILRTHQHVDLIFGTHNIHRLPFLLREAFFNKEMVVEVWSQEGDIVEDLPKARLGDAKAWVNIAYGCDKFCSYCIIPYTRGKERSRLATDIIAEVEGLVANGYQEVTLLGQNVNSYGKDLKDEDIDFAALLRAVSATGIPRVRFVTSHPWEFTQAMIDAIAECENIMPHVHLPVQSGSSEVLKKMRRGYTRESYIELYEQIRAAVPRVSITTDIIVGFPNETDEQFTETLTLVETCRFDGAYTFIYSPREGTPAARLKDTVSEAVKKERLQALNAIVNESALMRNKPYEGTEVKVLVHGESKRNSEVLSGYTEENKLVNFRGDASLIGKIVPVKVTQVKTWSLDGEVC